MDFDWTDEQLRIKEEIARFARNELNDELIERDKNCVFSREAWKKCADMGIQGLPFPTEYGGSGADVLSTTLAMEGLGYGCKDNGLIFAINAQMWSVQMPIWDAGSDSQKKKYLPRLSSGEWIGAHGMTEPNSGSDAFSLATTARRDGDRYILNGSKTFVTNAPIADVFLVFARTGKIKGYMGISAFIVEKSFPGLKVEKEISKMGLRTSPMAEVVFDDCVVPVENRLGPEGAGATLFNSSMEWERACLLAAYLGAMKRQLETCVAYARERRQFNRPISKFQAVANKIVDMRVRLETARLLLYKVAWMKQNRREVSAEAAMAKLYLSEAWVQSSLDAIQIHGGYGYTIEFEVERELRDAISSRIYSGTSEIQKNIIAFHMDL